MTYPIEVITMNVTTQEVENTRTIDHGNDSDRKWLGNHMYWAVRNGRGVQVSPVTEGTTK